MSDSKARADERRLMIVSITEREIMFLLTAWQSMPPAYCWFAKPDIPNDAVVVSVQANWARQSIDVMLRHESFEVAPAGAEVPRIGCGDLQGISIPNELMEPIHKHIESIKDAPFTHEETSPC